MSPPPDTSPSEPSFEPSVEILLRAAQHRVRNDLQTIFSLLRLTERRLGSDKLRTDDVLSWLNSFSAVYDALPIWDQNRRAAVKGLVSSLRERCGVGDVSIEHDDGVTVPGTSAVAVSLAISSLLLYARAASPTETPLLIRLTNRDGVIRIECRFVGVGAHGAWPPLNARVASDALGATWEIDDAGPDVTAAMVMPCR